MENKMLLLEITRKCNLNCHHCYNSSGKELKNEMSLDDIEKIIKNFKNIGGNIVCITGGEPLMRSDFKEIVDLIISNGIYDLRLATNATLINESNIDTIKKFKTVTISLDGFEKEHNKIRNRDCFKNTICGMKNVIKAIGVENIEIGTLIINENFEYIEKFILWLSSLGIKQINTSVPGAFSKIWTYNLGENLSTSQFRKQVYQKLKHLSRKHYSKIKITQTLSSIPLTSFDEKVFNCDPQGNLVPSIGIVPEKWILGYGVNSMERNIDKINKINEIDSKLNEQLLLKAESGEPIFWWEEFYKYLIQ